MVKITRIPLILLIAIGIVFLFFMERKQKIESIRRNLKGEVIFGHGRDALYILKFPTLELSNLVDHYDKSLKYRILFPSYPSWSPGGDKIAFGQYRKNEGMLTIIDLKDDSIRELTHIGMDCDYLSWSPNGEYIAFLARTDKPDYNLYVLSIKDMKYQKVSNIMVEPYSRPSWSPDSSKIVFSSTDHRIFVVNSDGTLVKPIIPYGIGPAWSPNGKYLVYNGKLSINLYDFQTGKESRLRFNVGFANIADIRDFAWSPDGKYILFQKISDLTTPIEIISIDGKEKYKLKLSKKFVNVGGFSWKY